MTKPAPSLGNYVYQQLLQQICVDNLYAIGAKLPPEERLAKEFGVSRPVVRIALAQLRTEGIIQSRQGSGSYVIRTSQGAVKIDQVDNWSDINQFYEYRAHLESEIARLAAERATAEDRERIQKAYYHVVDDYYKNTTGEASKEEESDMDRDCAFHLAIAAAAHNHFYYESLERLLSEMKQSMFLITKIFEAHKKRHVEILTEEHGWVLNAILSDNATQASAAMLLHIQNARDSIMPNKQAAQVQGLTERTSVLA